jgi:hypothetical protein
MLTSTSPRTRRASDTQNGIVAILDALGTATYEDAEIKRFIDSRDVVLNLLRAKAIDVFGDIRENMISVFTFNDTVLIVLNTGDQPPRLSQISDFFTVMRKFLVDSLANHILFRGAIAIGTFYISNEANIVMGKAVTDAASWYDKADWIGLHATPRASLVIQRLLEHNERTKRNVMLNYEVPLKTGKTIKAKAVNWPKVFFVPSLSPCSSDEAREKLLEFLTTHQIPFGTENKFQNTLDFFDEAVKKIKRDEQRRRKQDEKTRRAES